MPDELDHFFQCVESPDGWLFQVGIVEWDGPHTPDIRWETFRHWKTKPGEKRLKATRTAALTRSRFFRTCSLCHELNNVGHMHNHHTCQGCAERHLGVVH